MTDHRPFELYNALLHNCWNILVLRTKVLVIFKLCFLKVGFIEQLIGQLRTNRVFLFTSRE